MHGRLRLDSLRCNLGAVLDLSPGGARILSRHVPKGRVTFILQDCGRELRIQAETAWSRRAGWFRHEIGLRFPQVGPDLAAAISRIAMSHTDRRLIA